MNELEPQQQFYLLLTAIVSVTALEITALILDLDGKFLLPIAVVISYIAGRKVGQLKDILK